MKTLYRCLILTIILHLVTLCDQEQSRIYAQADTPVLAAKSNLLFDAATIVNLSVEAPLGDRYSISADAYFPWWKNESCDITIQLMAATLEGRYWFGHRDTCPRLTGWFGGLYAGGGYYDFQLGGDGVQGELFIVGGLSAGYAHTISKHLRLEYSVGLGYLMTDYRKYTTAQSAEHGKIKVREYPWEDKRLSGILPSKLSVSLVWIFNRRKESQRHD